jgi:integrase
MQDVAKVHERASGLIVVDARIAGKRVRRRFPTRAEADEFAASITRPRGGAFADACAAYLTKIEAECKPLGLPAARYALRVCLRYFGPESFPTTADVERFKTARLADGVKPSTVNQHLRSLKACLRYGAELGLAPPCPRIRLLKVRRAVVRVPTVADIERVVAAADRFVRPLIRAAFLTGARGAELVAVRCGDLSAAERTLTIRSPKGHEERELPLSVAAWDLLHGLVMGRPSSAPLFSKEGAAFTRGTLQRSVQRAFKRAGVKVDGPHKLHVLRKAFASHAVRNGADLVSVSQYLGHKSLSQTVGTYAVADTDSMRSAASKLG